jgi:hypothetical protein
MLFLGILLALGVALAASRRFTSRPTSKENRAADQRGPGKVPSQSQSQQPRAPQAVGPIDRNVIAGGGGTSTGANFRIDGTIAETSASNAQSGGAFSANGGFWNTQQGGATPTPTPSPTSTPLVSNVQFSAPSYNVNEGDEFATRHPSRLD